MATFFESLQILCVLFIYEMIFSDGTYPLMDNVRVMVRQTLKILQHLVQDF